MERKEKNRTEQRREESDMEYLECSAQRYWRSFLAVDDADSDSLKIDNSSLLSERSAMLKEEGEYG